MLIVVASLPNTAVRTVAATCPGVRLSNAAFSLSMVSTNSELSFFVLVVTFAVPSIEERMRDASIASVSSSARSSPVKVITTGVPTGGPPAS